MPARGSKSAAHMDYSDELVFEAALYMVWRNHPMRKPLGPPYPTVHPLYRRIAVLVQSRALDKMWAGYLGELRKDELLAWEKTFARLQGAKTERGGISLGLAWCEVLRRGLDDRLKKDPGA